MADDVPEQALAQPTVPAKRGYLIYFSQHPLLGFWSFIVGIASLIFTLIVFFLAQKERSVWYAVSASPTTIVRAGQSSDLRVQFKGKELNSDVSSIQIAIWNAGAESVRRENVLSKTVSLKLQPSTYILEARVKNVTRGVTGFELDTSGASSGALKISWDIFERGDGALLEVIYAGTSKRVVVDGAIEGQKSIREVWVGEDDRTVTSRMAYQIMWASIVVGLVRGIVNYRARKPRFGALASSIMAASAGLLWVIYSFMALFMGVISYKVFRMPSVPFPL